MLDTLGAVSRREQKQQILEEISWHHAVHAGYISRDCTKKSAEIFYNPWVQKEAKHSKSAKVKKEAKITRLGQIGYRKSQVLPEAKYHPKRHLSKQKPNLSWIRTGVDKKPNEIPVTEVVTNLKNPCDRSCHKSSKPCDRSCHKSSNEPFLGRNRTEVEKQIIKTLWQKLSQIFKKEYHWTLPRVKITGVETKKERTLPRAEQDRGRKTNLQKPCDRGCHKSSNICQAKISVGLELGLTKNQPSTMPDCKGQPNMLRRVGTRSAARQKTLLVSVKRRWPDGWSERTRLNSPAQDKTRVG